MPVLPQHSLTALALDAKFAPKQRRYQSSFSASYLHHPSPPPRLAAPPPNPTFEMLRAAAAHLNLPAEGEQHDPPTAAATLSAKRRPARKALLGTTAALALCALAAGSYYAWIAGTPDGGPVSGSTILATFVQRFHDLTADQAMFRIIGERIASLQPAPPLALPKTNPAVSPMQNREMEPGAPVAAVPGQPAPDALTPAPSASPPSPSILSDAFSPTTALSPKPLQPADAATPTPEVAGLAQPAPAQAGPVAFPPTATVTLPNATEMAVGSVPPVVNAQQLANILALVRQVGLLVRDMQVENERLRTQVAGLTGTLQTKVADLEQRLVASAHDMHDVHNENAHLHAQMATLADTLQSSSRTFEQRLNLALARNAAAAASGPGK